ncbi:HupE/UreJ family protein [Pseudoalteromonas mariniglutinosa]|uniref:HupE/UreJ family protein n=2 Tax=Pseudoalteromonas mariniglutinosa TaxID=206042 RepID=UPI00384CBD4D
MKLILLSWLIMISFNSYAHQLSTGYLELNTTAPQAISLTGSWQVDIADIEQQIPFDLNQDGAISWQEITAKQLAIESFVTKVISVKQHTNSCIVTSSGPLQLDNHFNQAYLVIPLHVKCSTTSDTLSLSYRAFFERDSNHKTIAAINDQSRIFSKDKQTQVFNFNQSSYLQTFVEYLYQGVLHIWLGLDHILFLIALLLTCVLVRKNHAWQANSSKWHIFKHTAWIVTAFTLAHSITLTATAMALISPNSRWVELGIAISVLFAALNNIYPLIVRLGWITFAFGLLHGMGFASVLAELGLSNNYQLLSVLAFNLGVEMGQLVILALALPILTAIRHFNWYQKWIMPLGSVAIALIAIQWSIERI